MGTQPAVSPASSVEATNARVGQGTPQMEAFARRRRVAKRQRQAEAAATSWHAVAHRPPRPDGSPLPGSQPLTLLLIVADSAGLAFGYITGVLLANAWERDGSAHAAHLWCRFTRSRRQSQRVNKR